MDAYRPYMRPPAPPPQQPAADPHYNLYQQQAMAPPRPSQGPWLSNQYQPPSSTPPPPPWAPPPPPPLPPPAPHSDHMPPPAYPTPPHHHPPHHGQLPPRPYMPPPQHLHPYPHQDWSSPNWTYQQGWNLQAPNEAEDWAARAKAWASAKAAMESQHPQAQYSNQYPQPVESQYPENHHQSYSGSAYQQHPHPATPPNGQPGHLQENSSVGPGLPSYHPDGRMVHSAKDGPPSGDPHAVFHAQGNLLDNQSVHQQEVPSSYSSVSGKEESGDRDGKLLHLPSSAAQGGMGHPQAPMPAAGGSVFPYASQYTDPIANPADQPLEFAPAFNCDHPLEFAPRFKRDQELLAQSVYAHHDSNIHTWSSSMTPDVAYPSLPTVLPSSSQHDPSIPITPSVSGHAPSFPRFPGPNFLPNIPPAGGAFGQGMGPPLSFSADSYALSGNAERPKKAPVPNWLREEIIKTKAGITSSSLGHPNDEAQTVKDEATDRYFEKGDQTDSKSMDSSKSTEEEEDDDDEDYIEAAKTAAINQEIKRVLTEVLLKVTDELFDEIATKVLNEDEQVAEDYHETLASDHMVSPTSHASEASRASAKALDLGKKDFQNEDISKKSSSSSGGNILGLANYASDDEDGEIQSANAPNSTIASPAVKTDSKRRQHDANSASDNGIRPPANGEHINAKNNSDSNHAETNLRESRNVGVGLGDNEIYSASSLASPKISSKGDQNKLNGKMVDGASVSVSEEAFPEKVNEKGKLPEEEVDARKPVMAETRDAESRGRTVAAARDGNKRTSLGESSEGPENGNIKAEKKFGENHGNKDGRHLRKEKTEKYGSVEMDHGKHGGKVKESEGRRRSGDPQNKNDRNDRERPLRENAKDDSRRTGLSRDKEEDRSRHRASRDMNRHKRRRSTSTGSRGRNSRDELATHGKNSSDEDSDDPRRKLHSRKRNLSPSPSPVKSRRRQVSRSPHSKHSQRRHSPHSSIEGSRERRRSRSRSPVRRHR